MDRRTAIFLMGLLSSSRGGPSFAQEVSGVAASARVNLGKELHPGLGWRSENFPSKTQGTLEGLREGGPRQTLSLDGTWEIAFDPTNKGRCETWYRRENFEGLAEKREIQVPNCWETIEKDYEGVAWYGLRFRTPEAWNNKVMRLKFGAVNYRAEVWINDQPAGFHDGGYTPFELSIGDLLQKGADNFLSVRVIGPIITKNIVIDGFGPNETPHWRGAIAGGIWQSVQLIKTDRAYFSSVFVQPHLRRERAVVLANIENSTNQTIAAVAQFALEGEAGSVSQKVSIRPGHNAVQAEIPIQDLRLWTPEHPNLYTLHSSLSVNGAEFDRIQQRFGMREFTIRNGNFYLNGDKVLVKGAFWEGFYPNTLAFPPNADLVRREIRLAKEAGFNLLRLWRKPPVSMILDLADEMGMMIIDAPPIECMDYWPQLTPETKHRIAIEVREMVERDRNHPCVVEWELFNEVVRPEIARLKLPMSLLARAKDPTRVVMDESGGWAGGCHAYLPYSTDSVLVNEIHSYLPAPVSPRTYEFYRTLGQPGFDASMLRRSKIRAPNGVIFVSEVGYGGLPDLPSDVAQYRHEGNPLTPDYRYSVSLLDGITRAMREMQWGELFNDVSALCQSSQQIQAEGDKLELEALRLNPRINGYCVHAYTDGDWVFGAGLLDLFRRPKLVYASVKHVQASLYVAVRVSPSNVREGRAAILLIDSVNDGAATCGVIEWEVVSPGGSLMLRKQKNVSIQPGVSSLFKAQLPAFTTSGIYTARVRFLPASGAAAFENDSRFFYLAKKDLKPPEVPFAVIDPNREITPFLRARKIRFASFTSGTQASLPVLVATDTPPDGASLLSYVRRGGVALFLKPPAEDGASGSANPAWFPLRLKLRSARGNWAPVNHGIRRHPIFAGLPSGGFMNQVYLSVCATETIQGLKIPPIVGSLSYGFSPLKNGGVDRSLLNYLGPGPVWWGADLVAVSYGRGQILLSTLRLKENLSNDPVAEKLLYNMIRWAASPTAK